MAYIKAAQNGNFSSPSTWDGGVVPTTGDYACTLTNRVVLDVDTGAHLCVNQTDWVAAGGTANASFQGGFNVPDGATRIITGSLRYDGSSSLLTNSSTTAALVFKNGSLTIDKTEYVSGYTSSTTNEKNVIYFAPTSTASATLTIVTSMDLSRGSSTANSGYYIVTIRAVGATSGMMVINVPAFNLISSASSSYMSSILYLTGTTGFDLNMNGNFFNGALQTNTGIINISNASTGIDNQKININTPTFGSGAVSSGYGIYANYISSLTFMENTTVNSQAATGGASVITVNYLRNQMTAPGTLTSSGFGKIDIGLSGGSIVCGNIIQTVNGHSCFTISGTGNITMGNITVQGTYASEDGTPVVSISSVGLVTVGNIYVPAGALYQKQMLSISSGRTSATVIGSIDATNMYVRTSTPFVLISGGNTSTTTINGSITGSTNGSTTDLDAPALYLSSVAVNQGQFTINGNVKAGSKGPGLQMVSTSQQNVTINGTVIGADYPGGATVVPAAVQSRGRRVLLKNIDTGPDGRHPVDGLFAFLDSAEAYYKGIDQTGTIVTLNTQSDITPSPSDVRDGVAVGSTTGTLVVPQVANVLTGIVFDNGSVGTLSPLTAADLIPMAKEATLDLVKTQVDKIQFKTVAVSDIDSNWGNVSLLLHCDGSNGNTTVIDETGKTVTATNATISTSESKFGDSSLFLNGNGHIEVPHISDFDFVTMSSFTIEAWVYLNNLSAVSGIISNRSASTNDGAVLRVNTNGSVQFFFTGGTSITSSPGEITTGTWYHLAVVRDAGVVTIYKNGTSITTPTTFSNGTINASIPLIIGSEDYSLSHFINGYLDEVRITSGLARYSANFTTGTSAFPTGTAVTQDQVVAYGTGGGTSITDLSSVTVPLAAVKAKTDQLTFTVDGVISDCSGGSASVDLSPVTASLAAMQSDVTAIKSNTDKMIFEEVTVSNGASDPDYSSVVLLSGCNTTSGASIFNAVTPNIVTKTGSVIIDNSVHKFGDASWYFDGTGGRVDVSSVDLHNSTSFTVELFVYLNATNSGSQHLIGSWDGSATLGWHIGLSSTGAPFFEVSGTGAYQASNSLISGSAITFNTWHHLALVKTSNSYKLFIDGTLSLQTSSGPTTLYNTGSNITIGQRTDGTQSFKGFIDSIRITDNVARYSGSFTPTTEEFIGINGTVEHHIKAMPDVAADLTALQSLVALLDTKVGIIKSKTDQLEFLVDGVKASGGNGAVDLGTELSDLETILTAIKTKTDSLTFTTGVNAKDITI